MNYMHKFVRLDRGLLHQLVSKLPDGIFSESASGAPGKGYTGSSRKGKGGGGGGRKGTANPNITDNALESISSKNYMQERKSCVEMKSTITQELRTEEQRREGLMHAFRKHVVEGGGNKKKAKRRFKRFKEEKYCNNANTTTKENAANASNHDEAGSDSDSDDESAQIDSQESLLDRIYKCDKRMDSSEEQLEAVDEDLSGYSKKK